MVKHIKIKSEKNIIGGTEMSELSSVACAFTKHGYEQFIKEYERRFAEYPDKGKLWQNGMKNKDEWLNNSEITYHNDNGEVLFRLPFTKWYEEYPEVKLFSEALDSLSPGDFLFCHVNEEGTQSYTRGLYRNNPFELKLASRIYSEQTGVDFEYGYVCLFDPDSYIQIKNAYNEALDKVIDKNLYGKYLDFYDRVFICHCSARQYEISTDVIIFMQSVLDKFSEDDYYFAAANPEQFISIGECVDEYADEDADETFADIELQTDISFKEPLPVEDESNVCEFK